MKKIPTLFKRDFTNNNQWLTEILTKLRDYLLEQNELPEFIYQSERHLTEKEAEKLILQKISELETEARIEEVKKLSDYYMRHDGEGEHKLAKQIIDRETELEALHQASLNNDGESE